MEPMFVSSLHPLPSESMYHQMSMYVDMFGNSFTDGEFALDVTCLAHHNYVCLLFADKSDKESRSFVGELSNVYDRITDVDEYDIEIIYVSMDSSKEDFNEFFEEMGSWVAIPFGDKRIDELRTRHGVTDIPTLIVFNSNGVKISTEGAKDVIKYGSEVIPKLWSKPKVEVVERVKEKENRKDESPKVERSHV